MHDFSIHHRCSRSPAVSIVGHAFISFGCVLKLIMAEKRSIYRYCFVPKCTNTTIATPEMLCVYLPTDKATNSPVELTCWGSPPCIEYMAQRILIRKEARAGTRQTKGSPEGISHHAGCVARSGSESLHGDIPCFKHL